VDKVFLRMEKEVREIQEGLARIVVPAGSLISEPHSKLPAFYNPKMRNNRDIAVLFTIAEGVRRIGEPMAGTGVRSIRIILENGNIEEAFINDLKREAVKFIRENLRLNHIGGNTARVTRLEANLFNIIHSLPGNRVEYLDLDPYGTPAPFIYSSIMALRKRGVLAVTATDTFTLKGFKPETAFVRYGVKIFKNMFPSEVAVRTLLYYISRVAASLEYGIEPLIAYTQRHYVRVYVRILRGPGKAKESQKRVGYIALCSRCPFWKVSDEEFREEKCPICSSKLRIMGPLWVGVLKDSETMSRILDMRDEAYWIEEESWKILRRIAGEIDIVGYYDIPLLASKLRRSPPSVSEVISSLREKGFKASRTVFSTTGVKTDASLKELVESFNP